MTTERDELAEHDDGAEGEGPMSTEAATRPARYPVSVAELRHRLGRHQTEEFDLVVAPHQVVASHNTEDPVHVRIDLASIEHGVAATGTVDFAWEGECRRCLEPTGGRMEVAIDEIFRVGAGEESDEIPLEGDQIDLVPLVVDAVVLSLPLAPLCRDDCAGPDPDRYPAITAEQAEEAQRSRPDPRWGALSDLELDSDFDADRDN